MKRFLPLVVVALLVASPAMAQSPEPSVSPNWRPAPTSTFAALEAALVPVNVEMRFAIADLFAGMNVLSTHTYDLLVDVLEGRAGEAIDAIAADAAIINANMTRLQETAAAVLAVLDSFPAEACSADYVGVVRTAFLLIGDSIMALRVGDLASANAEIGSGRYLFGTYADLVRSLVMCE